MSERSHSSHTAASVLVALLYLLAWCSHYGEYTPGRTRWRNEPGSLHDSEQGARFHRSHTITGRAGLTTSMDVRMWWLRVTHTSSLPRVVTGMGDLE